MGKTGKFLKIPYDFRWPTWRVIKERSWNAHDKRVFTPHIVGWGWSINFYQLLKKLRILKGDRNQAR